MSKNKKKKMDTSMMLSHSSLASTPVTSINSPDIPDRSMLSKALVVPELLHVVAKAPSTYIFTVLDLVVPLNNAEKQPSREEEGRKGEELRRWNDGGDVRK